MDIAPVIKTAERARVRTWLSVKRGVRISVEGIAVIEVATVKVAVVEVVAIDDRPAVGDVGVMVIDHGPAVPVISPVMPAPSKSSEEADSKSDAERDCRAGKKDSGHGIPAWVGDDGRPVDEPRIISRYIDHLRVGRFDSDGAALGRHLLLFVAVQLAGVPRLLPHRLNSISHILLLVGIGVAKGRSPRKVLVHVFKDRGKLRESLHARIPRLFVDFFGQLFTLEVGMTLHPAVCLDNLGRIRGRRENLGNQGVGVQGDRRDQLLDLLGSELRGRCWRWSLVVGLTAETVGVGLRGELYKQTAEN